MMLIIIAVAMLLLLPLYFIHQNVIVFSLVMRYYLNNNIYLGLVTNEQKLVKMYNFKFSNIIALKLFHS